MIKKLLILLLICLPLVAAIDPITDDTVFISTEVAQFPDPAEPGEIVEVQVSLENRGSASISGFQIELIDTAPFSLHPSEERTKDLGTISSVYENGATTVRWDVIVAETAVEGDQNVRIRYSYDGQDWVTKNVEVSVRTADPFLHVADVVTHPEKVTPGQPFTLTLVTENSADSPLYQVKFVMDDDTFLTLGTTNEQFVRTFPKASTQNVTFELITQGDADQTLYEVPLQVSWQDSQNTAYEKNLSFGLVVSDDPLLVPNIEETEVYTSGGKGTVTLSLSNVGVGEVKFVSLALNDTKNVKILNTRNVYLGNIDSDDFETAQYTIYAKGEESVDIVGTLNYKDGLNNAYSTPILLTLPLYSTGEAKSLGLISPGNPLASYIGFVIFVFVIIFWLLMLLDLYKRKMKRYRKYTWAIILILTTIFGAVLYYFMVKRHD